MGKYYSQINVGICECYGWFLEISLTETMRPEPGPEQWMEFYREWGMRTPIIEGGNDGQKTQEHARWQLHSWICQWEGKSNKTEESAIQEASALAMVWSMCQSCKKNQPFSVLILGKVANASGHYGEGVDYKVLGSWFDSTARGISYAAKPDLSGSLKSFEMTRWLLWKVAPFVSVTILLIEGSA